MKLVFRTQNNLSNCAISASVSTSVWGFDLSFHYLRRFCAMGELTLLPNGYTIVIAIEAQRNGVHCISFSLFS